MNYSINKGAQVYGSKIQKKKQDAHAFGHNEKPRLLDAHFCTLVKIQNTEYMSTHTSLKSKKSQNCPIDAQIHVHLYFFLCL